MKKEEEQKITKALMEALNKEKEEGEKIADFDLRVLKDAMKVLGIENL